MYLIKRYNAFRNLRNTGRAALNTWGETTSLDWDKIPEIKNQLDYLLTLPLDKEELNELNELLKN